MKMEAETEKEALLVQVRTLLQTEPNTDTRTREAPEPVGGKGSPYT